MAFESEHLSEHEQRVWLRYAIESGEHPAAPVFIDGKKAMTLRGENLSQQFKDIVEDYVKGRWG